MNCPIDYECEVLRKGPLQDFGPNHHRGFSRRGMHGNLHESPREDSACSFCFNKNNHNNLVYKNKINFCAGYFPDYILYPCVDIDKVKPDLRLFLNYYPTLSEGKYSKQTYNEFSKNNKQYFANQYSHPSNSKCNKCIKTNKTTTKGGSYKFSNDFNKYVKNQRNGVINNISDKQQV